MTLEEFKTIGNQYDIQVIEINDGFYGYKIKDSYMVYYYTNFKKSLIAKQFVLIDNKLFVMEYRDYISSLTPKRFEKYIKDILFQIKVLEEQIRLETIKKDFV